MVYRTQLRASNTPQLLVVDAGIKLPEVVASALERSGYRVCRALTGKQALRELQSHAFEAILIDWAVPDMSALDLLAQIRQASAVPVVLMAAQATPKDIQASFDRGADDFIAKPFDSAVLIERLARFAPPANENSKTVGRFRLWPDRHLLSKDEQTIVLTERESKLLDCLLASPDQPVNARRLFQAAWPPPKVSARQMLHMVETAMIQLQNKIETDPNEPRFISLVAGGYLFSPNPHDTVADATRSAPWPDQSSSGPLKLPNSTQDA